MSESDIPIVKLLENSEQYLSNTNTAPSHPVNSSKRSIIRRQAVNKGANVRELRKPLARVRSSPSVTKKTVLPIKPKQRNYPTQRASLWHLTEKSFDFSILLKNSCGKRSSSFNPVLSERQAINTDSELNDIEKDDCIKFFDVMGDSLEFLSDPNEQDNINQEEQHNDNNKAEEVEEQLEGSLRDILSNCIIGEAEGQSGDKKKSLSFNSFREIIKNSNGNDQ